MKLTIAKKWKILNPLKLDIKKDVIFINNIFDTYIYPIIL